MDNQLLSPQADEDAEQVNWLHDWWAKNPDARALELVDVLLAGAGIVALLVVVAWLTWGWAVGA